MSLVYPFWYKFSREKWKYIKGLYIALYHHNYHHHHHHHQADQDLRRFLAARSLGQEEGPAEAPPCRSPQVVLMAYSWGSNMSKIQLTTFKGILFC